jgi:hypothetical protein
MWKYNNIFNKSAKAAQRRIDAKELKEIEDYLARIKRIKDGCQFDVWHGSNG